MKTISNYPLLIIFSFLIMSCSEDDDFDGVYEGDYYIHSQKYATDIGLLGITEITGDLRIYGLKEGNTDPLLSLGPLSTLTKIGGSLLYDMECCFSSLDGLHNLTSVGGGISIFSYSIENLEALSNIEGNLTFLSLSGMDSLTNLNGFSSIQGISVLDLDNLDSLQNLNGLANLTSMPGGKISIYGNEMLTDISILEQVTFDNPSSFEFSYNPNLENIDFMLGISAVTDNISIYDTALPNLDALANLNSIGQGLSIRKNLFIQNLDGLSNITIIQKLTIIDNSDLDDLCGLQTIFQNGGPSNGTTISGNAYNPTEQDIIDGNCSL